MKGKPKKYECDQLNYILGNESMNYGIIWKKIDGGREGQQLDRKNTMQPLRLRTL